MGTPRRIDIAGQIFHYWTVLRFSHVKASSAMWICRCQCGKESVLPCADLRRGKTKSCGCMEHIFKHRIHGHAPHIPGKQEYRTYISYKSARGRCKNKKDPSYPRYGGRGIRFKFKNFVEFLKEVGERPKGKSLDRFPNNDGHYEPGNVRWATPREQQLNRRLPRRA